MTATSKHRLRWYQYSLRSLFVLTVLVAIGGSWFAVKRQQVKRQREAVKAIRELGGNIRFEWEPEDPFRDPSAEPPRPKWLRSLLGDDFFNNVTYVRLSYRDVADAGLEHLKEMPRLTQLDLVGNPVTDDGLAHLRGLTRLKEVRLSKTNVTDAGLQYLKRSTQLERLELNTTGVTDAGLEHLEGMTRLEHLSLHNTRVADAGLEHLKGLTQLRSLVLVHTKVTDEGVKKLQEALPNCKIVH